MIVEKGYAKINLGLEVVAKRTDGYHDLSMLMTSIDLYDELYLEDNPNSKQFIIDCNKLEHVPLEDNLIYKAYKTLKEQYQINKGVKVRVVKRIPEQAGLGGGSADCAATLRGLNKLWNLNLSLDDLAKIGETLGSDVPFCIYNKSAIVTGKGEKIEFIDDVPFAYLVMVFPNFKSSTAEVFKNFKLHGLNKGKINILTDAIKAADLNKLAQNLFNDLEYSSHQQEIIKIKRDLITCGALGSIMSGSGSTVFGICQKEKHAQMVQGKLNNIYKNQDFQIIVTTIRSFRNPHNSVQSSIIKPHKVLDSFEEKTIGMLMLGYQRFFNSYKIVLTPVNLYDTLVVEKIAEPVAEVYFDGEIEDDKLTANIRRLIQELKYGLRVKITRKTNRAFGLMSNDAYLSSVISGLKKFNADVDKLYSMFNNHVKAYRNQKTFFYDSKTDSFESLDDAAFGYVVIAPLGIPNYQSPKYTVQIDKDTKEIDALIEGIRTKNFYEMAANLHNGISKFEIRQIKDIKRYPYYEKLESCIIRNKASGCVLSLDGRSVIALFRNERQALIVSNLLKERFCLRDTVVTTIKSNFSHQSYKNIQLIQENVYEVKDLITDEDTIEEGVSETVYVNMDYEETSPFTDFFDDFEDSDEKTKPKSPYKKKTKISQNNSDNDVEGILSIHSGGSLFKLYDFTDIASYFEKYFHGKSITFNIEGEEIAVRFDTVYLPHILGLHLIDEKDLSYRGKSGFEKMKNGEISFYSLKHSGLVKENVVKLIFEKTQSAILIFNDIYNDRMYDISCFSKDILLSEKSKMKMLDFAITRKLTSTSYHKQNVLGIGKDHLTEKYFFYTSFLWDVPANIGKKDSYKIGISR